MRPTSRNSSAVQLNRGLITGFDAGHHHMLADLPRPCDQGDQQRFANPFTAMRLMDIHRVFYGMAIAVPARQSPNDA